MTDLIQLKQASKWYGWVLTSRPEISRNRGGKNGLNQLSTLKNILESFWKSPDNGITMHNRIKSDSMIHFQDVLDDRFKVSRIISQDHSASVWAISKSNQKKMYRRILLEEWRGKEDLGCPVLFLADFQVTPPRFQSSSQKRFFIEKSG